MDDILRVAFPLLLAGVTFAIAARFARRILTRLKVYRFHAITYPCLTVLGLATATLMGMSSSFDWWVDDATIYLELMFGISGVVLCIVLAPLVAWLERRSELSNAWRIGGTAVSTLTLLPYIFIIGFMLFYRE